MDPDRSGREDPAEPDWDLLSWVRRAPARVEIMRLLAKKPRTKSEIAAARKITWSWAHHVVRPLQKRGLVICLTSSEVHRGRIYGLTELGKRVAEHL